LQKLKVTIFSVIFIFILIPLTPVSASENGDFPRAKIISLDYPSEVNIGEEFSIVVTVEHWLGTEAQGLFVCVQEKDKRIMFDPSGGTPWPTLYVLESREHVGPLTEKLGTRTYYFKLKSQAEGELNLIVETYLMIKPYRAQFYDEESITIRVKLTEDLLREDWGLLANGGFDFNI